MYFRDDGTGFAVESEFKDTIDTAAVEFADVGDGDQRVDMLAQQFGGELRADVRPPLRHAAVIVDGHGLARKGLAC